MTFAVEQRPYVQVLHDSTQKHWLTIYNIVLFTRPASCRTKSSQINAHFVDVQLQSRGSNCGLFAIAYLLLSVLEPTQKKSLIFKAIMMQQLMKSIEEDIMTEFPVQHTRRS